MKFGKSILAGWIFWVIEITIARIRDKGSGNNLLDSLSYRSV